MKSDRLGLVEKMYRARAINLVSDVDKQHGFNNGENQIYKREFQ